MYFSEIQLLIFPSPVDKKFSYPLKLQANEVNLQVI
jgi:hypothetical protein